MIAYALRDNMAIGGRFIYSRSLLKLDKADLNLGGEDSDLNFEVHDYYSLRHSYSVAVIWRQYIPLGRNKRFALFNDCLLYTSAFRNSTCSTIPTSSRESPSQISDSAARPKYNIKKSAFSTSRHSCR